MPCVRVHKSDPHDVYVGRGYDHLNLAKAVKENRYGDRGWLGNPYPVEGYGRERCVELYERDLEWLLESEPKLKWALIGLYGKSLACHCFLHQEPCHGDILVAKVNELYWKEMVK